MKSPEEKAKELVERFLFMPIGHCLMTTEHAKQCALICCDEIIEAGPYGHEVCFYEPMERVEDCVLYWNKVKEEINKL